MQYTSIIGRAFALSVLLGFSGCCGTKGAGAGCKGDATPPALRFDQLVPPRAKVQGGPATTQGDQLGGCVRRPTDVRRLLLGMERDYWADEGAAHRGKQFATLTGAVEEVIRLEPPITEVELLEILGQPDYGISDQRGAEYIYLYDRNTHRDWAVIISVGVDGLVSGIGWNATSALDVWRLPVYPAWPKWPR